MRTKYKVEEIRLHWVDTTAFGISEQEVLLIGASAKVTKESMIDSVSITYQIPTEQLPSLSPLLKSIVDGSKASL